MRATSWIRQTDRLLGAVSLRDLVMAELERPVTEVMRPQTGDCECASTIRKLWRKKIGKYNLLAVPVAGRRRQRGGLCDC